MGAEESRTKGWKARGCTAPTGADAAACRQQAPQNVRMRTAARAHLARLAADDAVQVGALLVGAALVARVALRALGLEELRARLGATIIRTRHCA